MIRRPTRSTRAQTLLPYTPLVRSDHGAAGVFGPALAAVLRQGQAKLLAFENESVKATGVEILVRYGLDVPTPELLKLAQDTKVGPSVRLQILRLLAAKTESRAAINAALLTRNDGVIVGAGGVSLGQKLEPFDAQG